jgi:hypothetical protein
MYSVIKWIHKQHANHVALFHVDFCFSTIFATFEQTNKHPFAHFLRTLMAVTDASCA